MTERKTLQTADRLRGAGLRVTGSRLAILRELERNRTHPNAWDIHHLLEDRHPSLSVSTVYLTIETFARLGLVRRLPTRDGRVRVDGNTEPHDHAVCRDCNEIFDVPITPWDQPPPAALPRGVRVLGARVEYDVLCARCQRANAGTR